MDDHYPSGYFPRTGTILITECSCRGDIGCFFSSIRSNRLIVAPRKIDALKTDIYLRSEASRANMLVLLEHRISKGHLSDLRDKNTLLSLLFTSYASINSSRAHPPPGQPRGICYVVSPGGGALVNFIVARGLGISIPRGGPRAFHTRVFERWMSLSRRARL